MYTYYLYYIHREEIEIPLSQAPKETNQEVENFLAYCDNCLNPKQQAEKKGGVSNVLYILQL